MYLIFLQILSQILFLQILSHPWPPVILSPILNTVHFAGNSISWKLLPVNTAGTSLKKAHRGELSLTGCWEERLGPLALEPSCKFGISWAASSLQEEQRCWAGILWRGGRMRPPLFIFWYGFDWEINMRWEPRQILSELSNLACLG